MECYNCGATLTKEGFCPDCGSDVRVYKKIMHTANAYYNEGLYRAEVRDLTGAIASLKNCLRYNKNHKDARNLLGLAYFEMGETVEALSQWVISKNLNPKDNVAGKYLNEVQKNPAKLESVNLTIKKYNQALLYCKQNSCDLAVIQLKKVLSLNPKLVKGHQLLALLYIQSGKYDLAKKELKLAAKIDTNNLTTLRYMREVSKQPHTDAGELSKEKKKERLSSYQSGNDTIIQPPEFKDNTTSQTILNIVIGLAIGILITCFLVVPSARQKIKSDANAELVEANDTISTKNQTIESLQNQIDELNKKMQDNETVSAQAEDKVKVYEQFLDAYIYYTNGDVDAAGTAMAAVNPDYLEGKAKEQYTTINDQINAEYVKSIYVEGTNAYNSGNYDKAVENLQKVVDTDETYQDGDAVYFLAQSYRKAGNNEQAIVYYQKMVEAYPNTKRAANAQNYLKELGATEAASTGIDAPETTTAPTTTADETTGTTDDSAETPTTNQ